MDDLISAEFSSDEQPTGERWDPLGAPNDQDDEFTIPQNLNAACEKSCVHLEKSKYLEEEQDLLNSSLFALTTHFAQVQFRLRQIVDAPSADKETLLKSLEEFAFRGIPDVAFAQDKITEASLAEAVRLRRAQQSDLIEQLKVQLHELEQYAFESGEAGVPQDIVLERQRVILHELKHRMNLELLDEDKLHRLTATELKEHVDSALGQLVNPMKMKEHLVAQLKTQVADLERFIGYLQQADGVKRCACGCAVHSAGKGSTTETMGGIVAKTAALLQMFAMLQLGCSTGGGSASAGVARFRKNDLKHTMRVNHYGDLRARLEMAIARVREVVLATSRHSPPSLEYSSDCSESGVTSTTVVTSAVRKYLATGIKDLIEHGSVDRGGAVNTLVPFIGCFARRRRRHPHPSDVTSNTVTTQNSLLHAWELILNYYDLKNGDRFNSTPARKLSQSFNLEIAGASAASNKQNMLCAIGSIISTHTKYKRSYDSHFKAFICAALNANKLVTWLALLFQCKQLIHMHYHQWSYVVMTGFQDALQSLDTLTNLKFDLPVDLAIRQFQNIKDVFT